MRTAPKTDMNIIKITFDDSESSCVDPLSSLVEFEELLFNKSIAAVVELSILLFFQICKSSISRLADHSSRRNDFDWSKQDNDVWFWKNSMFDKSPTSNKIS